MSLVSAGYRSTERGELDVNFKKVFISELSPAKYNPRKDLQSSDPEYQRIKKSIEEFGYVDPVIVNADYTVIGGHQRIKVLKELGHAQIDVVVVDIPKSKEKALNVALNKITGEWDDARLVSLLQEIKAEGMLEFTGFDDKEFAALERELHKDDEPLDTEPQISRAEELRKEWGTELGQMWQCGEHRVICGDCTDPAVVQRVMGGEKASLFSTDPPYGVAYADETGVGSKFKKIANDENNGEKLQAFLESAFTACLPYLKDNAAWYLWHAQMTQGFFAAAAAAAAAGVIIHRQIIWVKPSLIMGHGDYHWKHELCFYGWVEGHRPEWYGDRKQTTVWEVGRENDHIHPTQKPVELFTRPLMFNTQKGDVALDPFMGSGSSLIACENTGRILRGIELDPGYVAVILQRYKDTFPDKEIRLIE